MRSSSADDSHLYRCMLDLVPVREHGRHRVEDFVIVTIARDDDVPARRLSPRSDRPHMKIVHLDHAVGSPQCGAQFIHIGIVRAASSRVRNAFRVRFQARGRMNRPMSMRLMTSPMVATISREHRGSPVVR